MRNIPSSPYLLVLLFVFSFSVLLATAVDAQVGPKSLARLAGRVVDARTGEPLTKVRVIVSGADQETVTDENGAFALENLHPGKIDLYITTVTFGLVKKSLVLKEGNNPDIHIALNEDAAALTENVTVTAAPFESTDSAGVTQQLLNKRELQQLSSVLVNDPIRAAQALPGVAANDDYRSEFSVRGAAFDRIGLYLDGILTENFVHTVAGGYLDSGSVSVIDADTVDAVALMSGAFPSKYGNRTGGILDIQTRDGNRVKPARRIQAALTGLAGVLDGPFANKRGSYLVAGRKSFIGYLVRRFNDALNPGNNPPVINVGDFQSKFIYDLSKRNQIGASVIFGDFSFDQNQGRDLLGTNQVATGTTRNLLANGHWTFTRDPHFLWQTRVFGLRTAFRNINRSNQLLADEHRTQFGVRSDVNYQLKQIRIESGLYVRHLNVDSLSQEFDFFGSTTFDQGSFKHSGTEQGYYLQDTWANEKRRVSLSGGLRLEHSGVTHETKLSPRASFVWALDDKWKVNAAAGRYYQFPDFNLMFGLFGNPALKSERSTIYNASIERQLGDRTRIFAEVYDRRETNVFFSRNEPRLTGTLLTFGGPPFQNSLNGYARGFEITVQRRSANKLAGWVSYGYSRTRLTDSQDKLTFASDSDQRHTLNVYGNYRFADTWNFSSEWRYGSGQPVPGFFGRDSLGYFLVNQRNQTRLPYYSRVDVRLSKAFLFKKAKLTLTAEVLNLLNHDNLRYAGFEAYFSNGRIRGQLQRVLPILPSAGVVIEF
ncbi:MAG TPA: TonB-dependent receptor [Pyrinomonadaceae bacterium]|nr:TonB-dependent receptor [Pyrinomonadaceae bacterium]